MKKYSIIFIIASIIVIGCFVFLFNWKEGPEATLSYKYKRSDVYVYDITYSSEGKGNKDFQTTKIGQNKYTESSSAKIKGEMVLEILENKKESYLANVTLYPKEYLYTYNNQNISKKPDSIDSTIELSRLGVVSHFYMNKEKYEGYSNILREILGLIELPLPATAKKSWQGEEKNYPNPIPTKFSLMENNIALSIYNVKKTYKERHGDIKTSGHIDYLFDNAKGAVASIEGERYKEYMVGNSSISVGIAKLTLALKSQSVSTVSSAINPSINYTSHASMQANSQGASLQSSVIKDTLTGEFIADDLKNKSYINVLKNDDFASLVKNINEIDLKNQNEFAQIGQKISALLYLYPNTAQQFGELLNQYEWDDPRRMTIAAALTDVSTPEAQDALIKAIEESKDYQSEVNLLPNLAYVKSPTVKSEEFFRELGRHTDDKTIQYKSKFSLGIMANNLSKTEYQRSENIFNEITAELPLASNEELVVLINSIGNMGLDTQVETLVPYLDHENKEIRLAAINALRHVDSEEARTYLLNYLDNSDEQVRLVAAISLDLHEGTSRELDKYSKLIFQEKSIPVLKQLIKNLAELHQFYPENIQSIDTFISRCAHKDICDYANSVRNMNDV